MIEKSKSRKYRLVILIIILASLFLVTPQALGLYLTKPFILINGSQWVTVISLIIGSYIGGNVAQHYLLSKTEEKEIESSVESVETDDEGKEI